LILSKIKLPLVSWERVDFKSLIFQPSVFDPPNPFEAPDASTFSQNLRHHFTDNTIYQEIFDEIVLQAMRKRLLNGKVLYTDSTHLKESANKHKFKKKQIVRSTREYCG